MAIYQVVTEQAPTVVRGPGKQVHAREERIELVSTCHVSNLDDGGTLLCGVDPASMHPLPAIDFDDVPNTLQCPGCRPHWPAPDAEIG